MAVPGPGYAITARVEVPSSASAAGDLTMAVGRVGGVVTAFDVVEAATATLVVDISCNALNEAHAQEITAALEGLPGVHVRKVSDRTFLLHLGGKIEVTSKVGLRNRDDLSRAYTPGVARICQAIAANPADARRLTIKRNTVAVVTDGSAVLGLGNLGAAAAMPVMEGKAALFKRFAGVDAWPVCLDTQDTEEIIRTVQILAPAYGGINLEDIAAPRCFEIEARLRELLDIPVFHDDQHGTAVVVLGALRNALRVVDKKLTDCKVVVCGVGAAGSAIIRLLQSGLRREDPAGDVLAVDIDGIVHADRPGLDDNLASIASMTNRSGATGSLADALVGADVFIGVSAPNLFGADELATMAPDAVVFALANPDPEVDPAVALQHAAVVATGRSDYPNQINNVLAFPGVFRGLLDAQARDITDAMLLAASAAIADVVTEPNASFIVPSVFDASVAPAVAEAVRAATAKKDVAPV
ncbi:NAD-dependent malic enzyme [Pseudonocardia sp. KRD-184]|uniref:NAD-dependent malic enzyme n=1 Tax=Pseudonocardia oceani TaxID=2792013 RepID=A0ABS6UJB3_9PSEU|nr:NAD-dependent malic enzyme [Pseudonocardia oceani]MBW0092423.1 NAD-dependent malic enzyme [Pseudonocardia oceani]MBW0099364.1 NAD-dependent malic enzyme [Pseudonocardia oceani]MBW0111662.1 NAD-dependent malic enzyme [Pseudonocardia oceani]MBW0125226.1 NAD-dependent malic enzyme [Pseudonocardia oceani]MBW0132324.1 NAD-dependent malic enzyme [Pseudonocardia oceani]